MITEIGEIQNKKFRCKPETADFGANVPTEFREVRVTHCKPGLCLDTDGKI